MDLRGRMDEMVRTAPECELLGFGDLSSGTVLCGAAAAPVLQEDLDVLLAAAAEALDEEAPQAVLAALNGGACLPLEGLLAADAGTQVVLRPAEASDEALFGLLRPGADPGALLPRLRAMLAEAEPSA